MVCDNQSASVDFNTAATQTVVAAVAGKRVYVLGYQLYNGVATAQTVQFKSGSNLLTGVESLPSAVGGGAVLPLAPERRCWFFTDLGAALTMVMSAATQVGGSVAFIQV
jgi:hypothetical protein